MITTSTNQIRCVMIQNGKIPSKTLQMMTKKYLELSKISVKVNFKQQRCLYRVSQLKCREASETADFGTEFFFVVPFAITWKIDPHQRSTCSVIFNVGNFLMVLCWCLCVLYWQSQRRSLKCQNGLSLNKQTTIICSRDLFLCHENVNGNNNSFETEHL